MDYKQTLKALFDLRNGLAVDAMNKMMRNPYTRYYVAGEFTRGHWGNLAIVDEESQMMHVIGDHIPRDRTMDAVYEWIKDRTRNTPLAVIRDAK